MVSQSYLKDVYINKDIDYLVSTYIREYDMRKANISILLSKGLITQSEFDYYASLKNRSVVIGLLQRDNEEIKRELNNGFREYRQKFFEANNIQDHEVLAIRKDAIFLISKEARTTTFDYVNFVNKNTYTSFYRIFGYEYYYMCDRIRMTEQFDVKGISDKVLPVHENYFCELLKCVFEAAELNIQDAMGILSGFLSDYMQFKVEPGFYREFNDMSTYRVNSPFFMGYNLTELYNFNPNMIDISYNRRIMELILSYYMKILMNK